MKLFSALFFLLAAHISFGQDFVTKTEEFRDEYKQDFLTSPNSPLKKKDLKYLRFYDADSTYKVTATFERTTDAEPFDMPTSSGKVKSYVAYGKLTFEIKGKQESLLVYRSLQLQTNPKYKDYLFIPFKDLTNGKQTYGGGRYIDLKTTDFIDNQLVIDFNRAYNPYCAFSEGYSCPIPPKANHLKFAVEAGEQNFAKNH